MRRAMNVTEVTTNRTVIVSNTVVSQQRQQIVRRALKMRVERAIEHALRVTLATIGKETRVFRTAVRKAMRVRDARIVLHSYFVRVTRRAATATMDIT